MLTRVALASPLLCRPGVVTKMKMQRTIVIRRDYLHYIRKYNRFEKRHKNMSVHLSPCFRCVRVPAERSWASPAWLVHVCADTRVCTCTLSQRCPRPLPGSCRQRALG